MAYQQSRDTLWLLTNKNDLVGVTIAPEGNVIAWHKHLISGPNVNIWGLTVIPNENGTFDDVWLIVERKITGAEEYHLEKIGADFDNDSLKNTTSAEDDIPIFLDGSIVNIQGGAGQVISGLDHLKGEEVTVTANGIVLEENLTVDGSGQVTLQTTQETGTRHVVGLPYTATLTTLDIEAGGDFGRSTGQVKRGHRVITRFYKTFDAKVRTKGGAFADALNFGTDAFTGLKRTNLDHSPDLELKVEIVSEKPYPCNVLNLSIQGVTYD